MIARMRWNAEIDSGDTPRVEELAQKHNVTAEVTVDEAGVTIVTVEGSQAAAFLEELGATDVGPASTNQ
jgi:hypothetical protein